MEIDVQLIHGLSDWVTAFATVALALLTLALVIATARMAQAMARPHVIVNLESNQWSMRHIDLIIENCGNAPAYDVIVKIDPPIVSLSGEQSEQLPLSNISIIRPGQSLVSFATDWDKIKDKKFRVEVRWKRRPKAWRSETLTYQLNMQSLAGVSILGRLNPMIQVAEEVKKIRDDWRPVAQGQRRTQHDVFSEDDRLEARRKLEERVAESRSKTSEGTTKIKPED